MSSIESTQDATGIVTKRSPRSVSETVSRLTDMLGTRGIKLFTVVDQSAEARQVGLELRETILVIFGNPVQGTPVMRASPLAALDLPLKLLIWADGEQIKVSYWAPACGKKAVGPGFSSGHFFVVCRVLGCIIAGPTAKGGGGAAQGMRMAAPPVLNA